jgi:hypothetical protein
MRKLLVIVVCFLAVSSIAAAQEQKTLHELVADGYEIKVSSGVASQIIFLQKGNSAYVCELDRPLPNVGDTACYEV